MKNKVFSLGILVWFFLHFASLVAIFIVAPEEKGQGIVQKIFY